ncbi:WW domain binding protein 11-domain-containing protein [Pseudoneurospora amorphoporcata]|uniref:WW domain binding protein 11-domain-containing protein n=1 Tax=Pseudoneurospora amorphoporcata TaxID=241081 RepID=A0AAN6NZ10_9PEZI|nr:WW domain binding protein 11-domain-containing protein [Pseudoneurospora amorphoporcata]
MPKEKNYNPVQAQRKADKAKEIKKGKAQQQAKRNEQLARRNPEKIQQQIDDLKKIKEEKGGKLTSHEEQVLEALEKDLKAVKKAREALGDKAPTFGHGPRRDGALGKRRREDEESSDSDVPEDVKRIPMPRDTPPPIPKEILDEWFAKRRAKRATNANHEPVGEGRGHQQQQEDQKTDKPKAPVVEVKTVYEAKPMVRDLRKEAVSAFVPTNVLLKLEKGQGKGGLMEPEEADQLERAGYLKTSQPAGQSSHGLEASQNAGPRGVTLEEAEEEH